MEQLIRPTGLLDPEMEIRPIKGQVEDCIAEIKKVVKTGNRILVTTLTKRMTEDLAEFLRDHEIKVEYLHSDIDAIERVEILRSLRAGTFDVLVGVNLLREGLDLQKLHWWLYWMLTRKDSYEARPASSKPQGGRQGTIKAESFFMLM